MMTALAAVFGWMLLVTAGGKLGARADRDIRWTANDDDNVEIEEPY